MNKEKELEKILEETYYNIFNISGLSRKDIRETINDCKKKSKAEGTYNLPEYFGEILIQESKAGNESYRKILDKAIKGGANEDDIISWWNLSDLERRMIIWQDNTMRLSAFLVLKEDGLTDDQAIMKLKKGFPIYGDPEDESNDIGENRPLPDELHLKVNELANNPNFGVMKNTIDVFSSMNAFLRNYFKK